MTALARIPATVTPAIEDIIIGDSPAIVELRRLIARIAPSQASVMITGPSGSGKELVARALHDASDRADKPFVAINCGAIPADLIESELFGHERGSFTGAHARRIGRFEEADGGTLFLDEIGDMRFDMQVKLLRVLEDRQVARIGGTLSSKIDVRIVCATHQDIDTAIAQGRFREDLYFRLCVIALEVPGLASRAGDIAGLVNHFQRGKPAGARVKFDASGLAQLMAHSWPGNVRELRNIVERAGVLFGGETIGAQRVTALIDRRPARALPMPPAPAIAAAPAAATAAMPAPPPAAAAIPIDLKTLLETMELERIQMALDMADGVISDAARLLTLKRTTLIEKMRKYGVERNG